MGKWAKQCDYIIWPINVCFFSLLLILFTNTYFIYIDFATMYIAMVTTSQGVGDGQMGQTM